MSEVSSHTDEEDEAETSSGVGAFFGQNDSGLQARVIFVWGPEPQNPALIKFRDK